MELAIIISLTSLATSLLVLYSSSLKFPKIKFKVYRAPDDVQMDGCGSYHGVSTAFTVVIPVMITNQGASAAIIKDIQWTVLIPRCIDYSMYMVPDFKDEMKNNYYVFKPYESRVENVAIRFEIPGKEKGINSDEYIKAFNEVRGMSFSNNVKLEVQYKESKLSKMKLTKKTYDISGLVEHGFKKLYASI
ncbi:MAG: hypothetical protein GX115_15260 [Ruminiclostridium sp.]|mgnify:CR=1 FL=1|nr:hypothetical protein [Ruminiclostridium sp.]